MKEKTKTTLHPSKILCQLTHDVNQQSWATIFGSSSFLNSELGIPSVEVTRKPTPSSSTMFHQKNPWNSSISLQNQAMLPLAQCQAVCWSMPETSGWVQWSRPMGLLRFYHAKDGHCLSARVVFIQISCPKPYDHTLGKAHLVDFGGGHLNFKAMPPANTTRRTAFFKGRWWLEHERP